MKFFFPDSQDMVDPSFDFETEARAEFRLRQRDDHYAHEIFEQPPFDGILISKAIVEGAGDKSGKYSLAQRHRLLRLGVRNFLRLPRTPGAGHLLTMGDCGAFSYKDEEYPPFSAEDVVTFYAECGFDLGLSVDHAILDFSLDYDQCLPGFDMIPAEHKRRQEITLELAQEFHDLHWRIGAGFTPIGVAQGWSPNSYAHAVEELQKIGYRYIALGGMVPLKTDDILASLERVSAVRRSETRLHLLGVTRCEQVESFQRYGAVSFDSTSPFLQAFKDAKDNYHTLKRTYMAIRVPQVEGNPKLKRQIKAGQVEQKTARLLEQECLDALNAFDRGGRSVDEVLGPLSRYEQLYDGGGSRSEQYRQILEDRPWKECSCEICRRVGIHVIIFRGSERNKRRGFHNLSVFFQRLHRDLGTVRPVLVAPEA